jgi:hypothetical protein
MKVLGSQAEVEAGAGLEGAMFGVWDSSMHGELCCVVIEATAVFDNIWFVMENGPHC